MLDTQPKDAPAEEDQGLLSGSPDQVHPDYNDILPDWDLVRDALAGELTVKSQGETYLPIPTGFTAQEDGGAAMYGAYKMRAKFPEMLGPTIRGMVGIIHRIPAEILLPKELEPLRDNATKDNLPLSGLHERITYELLCTGRFGLLVDAEDTSNGASRSGLPFLAGYRAEHIINWDSLREDFFVLDESHLDRDGFTWRDAQQYRVLMLDEANQYSQVLYEQDSTGTLVQEAPVSPAAKGGKPFDKIPFVVIGSTDITAELDEIPLITIARSAFVIYRLYADYFWQLFMSGQETLFVSTEAEDPVGIVGAGVVISLPPQSKAEYVGPKGVGIAAHKTAIEDERQAALIAGARIFDTEKKTAESGDALKMRWTAQTASLTSIAINSGKGLERALKWAAMFMGANPDEVSVKPNLRFIDSTLDPLKAKALMELWMGGAISYTTLWGNLQRGDIGTYDRDAEAEKELIDQEMPDVPPTPATGVGGTPEPVRTPVPQLTGRKVPGGVRLGNPGGAGTGNPFHDSAGKFTAK